MIVTDDKAGRVRMTSDTACRHTKGGTRTVEDLGGFLDRGIRELGKDALRMVARRPALILGMKRLADGLAAAEAKRNRAKGSGLDVPPFMIASITKICNLGCAGCYDAANSASRCTEDLPAVTWGRVFAEAAGLGVAFMLLAGGEPLERQDVLDEAARRSGIVFPVFTNGLLIDGKAARFFARNRNMIPIVSLEGGRQATDARRGPGVFDKVMEAMELLSREGVFFGTSLTMTRANIEEAASQGFIGMLRSKGVGAFIYVEYVPVDGKGEDLAFGKEERKTLASALDGLREGVGGIHISFPGDEEAMGGCLAAGRGFVHINHSGGLEPCPFSPVSDVSLKDMSLKEALGSPFLKRLRESGLMGMEHLGGCSLWNGRERVRELLRRQEE